MTFSIAARCTRTGMLGIAVSSSSPAVAARCAYARAQVGAVGSQNITDPMLGPRLLDLMALGATAPEAVRIVAGSSAHIAFRQLLAVDAAGRTGVFSGAKTLGTYAAAEGEGAAAAGNMLRSKVVPERMLSAFLGSTGALGRRLLAAMRAGLDAGGEEGPVHSSGLLIVRTCLGLWPACGWTGRTQTRSPISSACGRCTSRSSRLTSPELSIHRPLPASAFRGTHRLQLAVSPMALGKVDSHRRVGRRDRRTTSTSLEGAGGADRRTQAPAEATELGLEASYTGSG